MPIVLDGATTAQFVDQSGLTSFNTGDPSIKRYVSENPDGANVITAYQTPRSSYVSTTTFDLPAGFHPEAAPGGAYYLTDGNTIRGAVLAPWALDATGRTLETSYSWHGLVLTQTVTVPSDAVFPIVADPNWSYTWTAVIKVGSPAQLHTAMHNCFNCIFPVPGAPAGFPSPGQSLPLTLSIGPLGYNFHCTFRMESFEGSNPIYLNGEFGFVFDAASGHIDGIGSSISFDFYTHHETDTSIKMRFTVVGQIVNDNPGGLPQVIYLPGAKAEWGTFMSRVVGAVGGPADPQAQVSYWNWIN